MTLVELVTQVGGLVSIALVVTYAVRKLLTQDDSWKKLIDSLQEENKKLIGINSGLREERSQQQVELIEAHSEILALRAELTKEK